jgi:hypothetical protein
MENNQRSDVSAQDDVEDARTKDGLVHSAEDRTDNQQLTVIRSVALGEPVAMFEFNRCHINVTIFRCKIDNSWLYKLE